MALLHVPVYLTLILTSSSCPTPSWLQPLSITWQRVSGSQGLQNPPPAHALCPWPRLLPPSWLVEIQFCPHCPQIYSSHSIPPQLPHHPSFPFWIGIRGCTQQAHWVSVTCYSEWMAPSASETMASEWRFYHTCRLWPWPASGATRASVPHVQNGTVMPASQVGSRSQLTHARHSVWPREGKRKTFIQ